MCWFQVDDFTRVAISNQKVQDHFCANLWFDRQVPKFYNMLICSKKVPIYSSLYINESIKRNTFLPVLTIIEIKVQKCHIVLTFLCDKGKTYFCHPWFFVFEPDTAQPNFHFSSIMWITTIFWPKRWEHFNSYQLIKMASVCCIWKENNWITIFY